MYSYTYPPVHTYVCCIYYMALDSFERLARWGWLVLMDLLGLGHLI